MFREQNLHRIQANYVPRNERSGGLLRRLGFVVEGYARDYLLLNGTVGGPHPHQQDERGVDGDG